MQNVLLNSNGGEKLRLVHFHISGNRILDPEHVVVNFGKTLVLFREALSLHKAFPQPLQCSLVSMVDASSIHTARLSR